MYMQQLAFFQFTVLIFLSFSECKAQSFVFAELNGSPSLNTSGWNLNGNAFVGDTGGDTDNFSNELILTNAFNTQSGGVFYATPIDPSVCSKWTVEFEYRIWGGNAADGLAFCFLDVPPTGFVSGGGVGIPGSANGLKVILDTWNNCGGANPELQIYSGVGYNECIPGIVKVNNVSNSLSFVRSNSYQPVKITYVNGLVTLFINNTQYLSANFPINFSGFMGFTASTGGANDQHSIRNVIIYTDQAVSDAGTDISYCSNATGQIGSLNNSEYVYSWSPGLGLNDSTLSNPIVSITNNGTQPVTQVFTVSTSYASNPGICPSTDQVSVTVHPNFMVNINDSICDGDSYNFNGQSLNTAGIYNAALLSTQGCDSMVNLNLSVNPIYEFTIDTTVCQGSTLQLGGQTLGSAGSHVLTLQSLGGCDSTLNVNIALNDLPNVFCEDEEICFGESITLIPSGANAYTWQPNIGVIGSNGEFTVTPSNSTNFVVIGTDLNNCVDTTQVNVIVHPLPNVQLTSNQTVGCVGDNIALYANGATQFEWVEFPNDSSSDQNFIGDASNWYHIVGVDSNNCSAEDSIFITIHPTPILTITPDQSICLGESANIIVNGADTYVWTPEGQGNQYTFTPTTTTDVVIAGTDTNNCTSSINSMITVNPNPTAGIEVSPLITTSDSPSINLVNTSTGNSSSILDLGNGTVLDYFDDPLEYSYAFSEGNYWVVLYVENIFGCSDSTQVFVQIKGDELIYIPNSFTPDADEFNNVFLPVFTNGYDPSTYSFSVFDRWGELMFESRNTKLGWDGTFRGKACPIGTYTWKIRYKNQETNEYKLLVGHINLIR